MRERGGLIRRYVRSRVLGGTLGIALCLAWALFLYRQLPLLQPYLHQIKAPVLIAAVGWGTTYFGGLAFCWAVLLNRMSTATGGVAIAATARVWLQSMIARYIPGNVWHIAGRVMLATQSNVSAPLVIASATIEQLMMLLAALGLCALTLPFWNVLPSENAWLLLVLPLGLACLHPRVLNTALASVGRLLKRPQLAHYHTWSEIVTYLVLYQMAFLCAGFALLTLLVPLAKVSFADVPFIVGAASLAWAIGFLSFFTPSGLGVREAALIGLLAQQYPLPTAVAASLLFRLVLTLGEMLAVVIAYSWGRFLSSRIPLQ